MSAKTPTPPGVPDAAQPVTTDDFTVPVRLLRGPARSLLIETESETRARYAERRDVAYVAYAADDPKQGEDALARLAAAEEQEVALFQQLEAKRGGEYVTYEFRFRVATVADHEAAEAEAVKSMPRSELVYARALAARTLLKTDYPGFASLAELWTAAALYVMRAVVDRVTLTQDVRAFL